MGVSTASSRNRTKGGASVETWIRQAEARRRRRTLPRIASLLLVVVAGLARGPWLLYCVALLVGLASMTGIFWIPVLLARHRVAIGAAMPRVTSYLISASTGSASSVLVHQPPQLGALVHQRGGWQWRPLSREGRRLGAVQISAADLAPLNYVRLRRWIPRPERGYVSFGQTSGSSLRFMVWDFGQMNRQAVSAGHQSVSDPPARPEP